jgi:hypothetical protein
MDEVFVHIVEDNNTSPESELVYVGQVVAVRMADSLWPTLIFRGARVGSPGSRLNYVFPCPGRWTVHIPLDGGIWRWEPGGPLDFPEE